MPYDLFISYSRRDNERGHVTALKLQIEASFHAFAGRDLHVFFDIREIRGMDDWRQKIQRSLRDSQLFLAVLSPNYLTSPYCRWEWEDYVRYEAMRQCLGEGVAPVYFVTLPGADNPKIDQAVRRWIDEIQRRQTFDLRPWHDAGDQALQQAHVKETLEQLQAAVHERLNRAECSRNSPNNLIKHNPAFVGRVRELTALRDALTRNKLGVVGAHQGQMPGRATVQGLGGMGKTELAMAYAHAFAWDYPGGRWQIACEHLSDLRVALRHLSNANALNFSFTEEENKDIALAFERILRQLNRRERCLLILDNVSDSNLLQPEYVDRLPRDGRVDLIATTRMAPRAIPGSIQEHTFIAVDELPEEDALALMLSHQPQARFASAQEEDEARAIVRLLRGFTLAVETAAIYLGRDALPDACRRFRERLSPDLLRESETAATDLAVAVRHRVRSLEETLSLTLETLTPEALHLLTVASLLPADQVALPWIRMAGARGFPVLEDDRLGLFRDSEELLLGLRLFQSAGIVDMNGQLLVVRMHRLVQDIVRRRAQDRGEREQRSLIPVVKEACEKMRHLHANPTDRWLVPVLQATADAWIASALGTEPHLAKDAAFVTTAASRALLGCGSLLTAEGLLRRALNLVERAGLEADSLVAIRNNLGEVLQEMGRLTEAEPLFRQALAGMRPNTTVMNNLARLLLAGNRLDEAEHLCRQALRSDEQEYGPSHPEVGPDINTLALVLKERNNLHEAEQLLRRGLAIERNRVPPDPPILAGALNNLGDLLYATGRTREAEQMFREALAIDEKDSWPTGPTQRVALRLNNLAEMLRTTNRLNEAEPLYRRAIGILDAYPDNLYSNHPQLASTLNNLALLLHATKRSAEAEPLFRRALSIWKEGLGDEHAQVAVGLGNLAELLRGDNRLTEARPLARQAVVIIAKFTAMTRAEHPLFHTIMEDYYHLLIQFGHTEQHAKEEVIEAAAEGGLNIASG